MILADTTVWIDHLRAFDPEMDDRLKLSQIVIHPFVIGELSMGSLRDRCQFMSMLERLVCLLPTRHSAVLSMVENRKLYGTGLQYIDAHLLASTLITEGCKLWTRDKRLHTVAVQLGIAA